VFEQVQPYLSRQKLTEVQGEPNTTA